MVFIDKLVCKGFKSFGRETVTIRLNPGFTCIVGPNGSGKSNVVDAVLFVLGQLSAKTLRANVFSDLLYSPPKPDMPPRAKAASVELHFNNTDRKLQIEADKVVIERELDESGKSVCRINGKTVTRTQVLEVLGSIGVDPNGYNLVLQGEIAQIVKVSPNDRRKLIEEIAGISAYDEQKERAMKKLAESEANLGKVDMQLQERRRQLERLELERTDALRYNSIQDQIRQIKIDNTAWNLIKQKRRIEAIDHTLQQRAVEAENLQNQTKEIEKGILESEAEIEDIDAEVDRIAGADAKLVSEQYGLVSAAQDHAAADLDRAKSEFDRTWQERESLEGELRSVKDEIEQSEQQIEEQEKKLSRLDVEIEETSKEVARLESRLENEQSSLLEATHRLQDLNKQMAALDEGVSEVRSALKSDRRELGLVYEELQDTEEGLRKTLAELEELDDIYPAKRTKLEEAEETEKAKRAELYDIEERLKTVDAEVRESSKVVGSARDELIRLEARKEALREAEEAFLKRRRAIAKVLELRDSGTVAGILGTVAELGTINPDYAVALEVAAGNRLSHIVVEDEHVATECVNTLKRERVGRSSFIPLSKIKTRAPGKPVKEEGVVGYALDLVSFDSKVRPAFEFVFTDTVVTEDFESAKRLGFKGRRAVSLDGDLVERSGLITGGHYQRVATGLSLQEEDRSPDVAERLGGLEEILESLKTQQEDLRKQKSVLDRELQDLSKKNYRDRMDLERIEESLEEKKTRVVTLEEKLESSKALTKALEQQISELQERDTELTAHREDVRSRRDGVNETLVKSDVANITQEGKDLKEILEHYKRERETLLGEITGLRVGLDERLRPRMDDLDGRLKKFNDLLPTLEKDVKDLEGRLAEKQKQFEDLKLERERIDGAVKDKRVYQLELKEKLRNLRLELEETRENQTNNEKAVYRLTSERGRLETDSVALFAELDSFCEAQEEVSKREQKEEPTRREIDNMDEKILELQRELEAMGLVNLKSIADYEIEREKYDEIVDKKRRLEDEHKEILAFMEEIEAEKTRKFLQVYNDIADNFSSVFAKLSPGGEASLMLENPEHPLMGGITVRSKPRGKDLVTLDAMSGGEKTLTGLALIFAIQLYSPASFYVFDEIDAALDDVNAHNVALLISEMAKSSQFVVVSLRDTTVRKADLLIGVSNQDGISRIVSVDLEEVGATA
ncbi:MAG: chromosome segregation protein SMC [Candidatus Thorarchaeota archaeon]|nr:MAG: chromosome segregation protein SMC [Candidatus Thorarchaeota archaeon]